MASWARQAILNKQRAQEMSQKCKCGRGYCSLIDGKCSNCRTKREQQAWLSRPSKPLSITVVNKHHGETGEYIGRGSPLGNPFPINNATGQTREKVIADFKYMLEKRIERRDPVILNELERLGNLALNGPLKLQCFCCPQACHGDVIKQVLFDAISRTYPETHWWLK